VGAIRSERLDGFPRNPQAPAAESNIALPLMTTGTAN
jgi:hypothetical protein